MNPTPHRVRPARRTTLVTALAAAAILTLAGCAGDPQPAPATPAPQEQAADTDAATPDQAPDQATVGWAGRVCRAVSPVVNTLRMPPPVRFTDAAATRQDYLDYLDSAARQAQQAVQEIDAAGAPPVEGGEALADEVRSQVGDLQQDLAQARSQVETADPGDPAALGQAIAAAGNVMGSLGNSAQAIGEVSADPRLHAAFQQAPECEQLRTIGNSG
jgi:hypothetical protein